MEDGLDDHKANFNDIFSLKKPKDAKAGLASGLKSVGKGIVGGAVGLIAAPIVGASQEGFTGFAKGLATGGLGWMLHICCSSWHLLWCLDQDLLMRYWSSPGTWMIRQADTPAWMFCRCCGCCDPASDRRVSGCRASGAGVGEPAVCIIRGAERACLGPGADCCWHVTPQLWQQSVAAQPWR